MLYNGRIFTGPDPLIGFYILYIKGRICTGIMQQTDLLPASGFQGSHFHSGLLFGQKKIEIVSHSMAKPYFATAVMFSLFFHIIGIIILWVTPVYQCTHGQ